MKMMQGIVAMENREVVPTPCAEKPGEISYISASIDTIVAEGIEVRAVAASIHIPSKPRSFIEMQTIIGRAIRRKKHR